MRKCLIVFATALAFFVNTASAENKQSSDLKPGESAGEFSSWGVNVSRSNYYFAKGAIMVFGTKWGNVPQTPEELEERTWEDLLLSYEAHRRGIKTEDKELQDEVDKMLKAEKVTFDRQKEPKAYADWIKEKTGEGEELFDNQLRHLIQLQKLRQQIMDSIKPEVSEKEAYQEFLNEYNTLSVQLAQFDSREEAKNFYARVKNKPKVWEKEEGQNPKLFRKPGFVAAEFLIEMWQFPKDEVYKMLSLNIGTVCQPIPIYGGKYAVCKILEKRLADPSQFPKLKDSYYKQIEMKKKYEGLGEWIKKLKGEAGIRIYKNVEILSQEKGKSSP